MGNCERCSAYKRGHLYRDYCNFIGSLRRLDGEVLVTEDIEAFAQCSGLRRRVPSERSPRGIKEGNEIRSGGMVFWNVLRGTNVSEEPAAYLAGQNNV